MQPKELAQKIVAGTPPAIVDVRTGIEFRSGHIPGAIHAPTWKIALHLASLPADRRAEMVIHCELGPRAVLAKGLLRLFGYDNTMLLDGHLAAWRRLGLPLEKTGR